MEVGVTKGPHSLALEDDAISKIKVEARGKSSRYITEQKKSFKGACVHHGALEGKIFACSMKELARRVTHIRVHTSNGTTRLCAYWDSISRGGFIDRDMSFNMKFAAEKLGYPSRNILLDRIDTHSNQVGGACEIKLAQSDD